MESQEEIFAKAYEENVVRVGITGYATAGKDEIADVLVEEYGFVKIGMSDALNNYLRILNPVVAADAPSLLRYSDAIATHGYVEAKARYPEVRRLLQVMGTEIGRAIDSDMWVKELNKLASNHQRVVTTGIRFPNEYTDLTCLIAVERPGVGPLNDHPSENIDDIIDQADYFFNNDGTVDLLRENVRSLAPSIIAHSRGAQE
jgi:hypothetical protein